MKARVAMLLAACAIVAACAGMEDRDAYQDKRIEFNRAALACGANTDCLRKLDEKKNRNPER